jgi:hypothetical protein
MSGTVAVVGPTTRQGVTKVHRRKETTWTRLPDGVVLYAIHCRPHDRSCNHVVDLQDFGPEDLCRSCWPKGMPR